MNMVLCHVIAFRQYLKTCIKNAVREKWRTEEKGKKGTLSLDVKIGSNEGSTLLEKVSDTDERIRADYTDEERKKDHANALNIWKAVMLGYSRDLGLNECTRDVLECSFADSPIPVSELAEKWGITENNVYQIKNRKKKESVELTRAIYKMMSVNADEIDDYVYRLHKAIAEMRSCKNVSKFLIALAKEIIDDTDKRR